MSSFLYFAYGSNMLVERLAKRCSSAQSIGVAAIDGYSLTFSKLSQDESGKATIEASEPDNQVHGAVFQIQISEREELDVAEGDGYLRVDDLMVMLLPEQRKVVASAYIAKDEVKRAGLQPYDWYMGLILAGAAQQGLPSSCIAALQEVEVSVDPKLDRKSRQAALRLYEKVGYGG